MNEIYSEFTVRLRRLRSLNKQGDFAKMLDIPQPTLSAYEHGKITPKLEMLIKIADKCDVSLDWLIGRDKFVSPR